LNLQFLANKSAASTARFFASCKLYDPWIGTAEKRRGKARLATLFRGHFSHENHPAPVLCGSHFCRAATGWLRARNHGAVLIDIISILVK
jgi:hypothetical protein